MTYIKGVDVSTIQGNIDWPSLKAANLDFAVLRCGVGNGGIDSNYKKNVAGATAAGVKVMAYHFIYPLPPTANGTQPLRDPVKQANYHFNAVEGQLAAIDCEWPLNQDWGKWGCNPAQLRQWMQTYLDEYTRLDNGRKPLIYTFPYWAKVVAMDSYFSQYGLWIASYQATPAIPAPWTDWVMWQYGSGGNYKLPNGAPVDVDYVKDLSLWNPPGVVNTDNGQPAAPPVVVAPPSPPTAPPPSIPTTPPVPPAQDPLTNIFTNLWNSVKQVIK